MATVNDAQAFVDDAGALSSLTQDQLAAIQVYLLWLSLNPGGTMTRDEIQTLVAESSCVANCMTFKQLLAAQVVLLDSGAGGGGGGGGAGGTFTTGAGSPEGVETGVPGDRYGDTNTGTLYTKWSGSGNTGWQVG